MFPPSTCCSSKWTRELGPWSSRRSFVAELLEVYHKVVGMWASRNCRRASSSIVFRYHVSIYCDGPGRIHWLSKLHFRTSQCLGTTFNICLLIAKRKKNKTGVTISTLKELKWLSCLCTVMSVNSMLKLNFSISYFWSEHKTFSFLVCDSKTHFFIWLSTETKRKKECWTPISWLRLPQAADILVGVSTFKKYKIRGQCLTWPSPLLCPASNESSILIRTWVENNSSEEEILQGRRHGFWENFGSFVLKHDC